MKAQSVRVREAAVRSTSEAAALRYRGFFEAAPVGMCRVVKGGTIAEANPALAAILGYPEPAVLLGRSVWSLTSDRAPLDRLFAAAEREGLARETGVGILRRDGTLVFASVSATVAVGEEGAPRVYDVLLEEVTGRNRLAQALRESEQKLQKLFQTSLDAIAINTMHEGKYLEVNDEFVRLTGYERHDVVGRTSTEIGIWCDPLQLRFILREIARKGIVRNLEGEFRAKDGSIVTALFSAEQVMIGAEPCILSITRDIRDRKRAEEALRESEHRYRALFEESNDVIFVSDPQGRLVDVNPAAVALFGCDSKEELLQTVTGAPFYVEPGRHAELVERLAHEGQLKDVELDLQRKDGTRLKTMLNATRLHDAAGNVIGVLGSLRDVTERTRLQEQLLQSQRMEAIGRLAGGVAHDFNNLLTVIRASAGLGLLELPAGDPVRARLEEIDEAAGRSAELTSQLLAFARRQVVTPQVLDLSRLIRNLEKMLRRVIGEDVTLLTKPAEDLWSVRGDRGQIEQVVVNLAVNARDAMPHGGMLLLETSNVSLGADASPCLAAGDYVCLVVADSGCGMSETVRRHLFEPFFTTKESGKGTGLGLATCYGIVKQCGGHIEVDSGIGRGTSFRIWLPRIFDLPEESEGAGQRPFAGGCETVLVLEDDAAVRRLTVQVLREQGYRVLETGSAEEALAAGSAAAGESIDLLVSDVVLPKSSGPEVAERLCELRPRLKVLFTSGHPHDSRLQEVLESRGAAFLPKPFGPDSLAAEVRRVLDRRVLR